MRATGSSSCRGGRTGRRWQSAYWNLQGGLTVERRYGAEDRVTREDSARELELLAIHWSSR